MALRTYKSRKIFLILALSFLSAGILLIVGCAFFVDAQLPPVVPDKIKTISSEDANDNYESKSLKEYLAISKLPVYDSIIPKKVIAQQLNLPILLLKVKAGKYLRVQDKNKRKSPKILRPGGKKYMGVELVEVVDSSTVKLNYQGQVITRKVGVSQH